MSEKKVSFSLLVDESVTPPLAESTYFFLDRDQLRAIFKAPET